MTLDGIKIYDLTGFKQHFSMDELLLYMKNEVILQIWINELSGKDFLSEEEKWLMGELSSAFTCWRCEKENESIRSITGFACFDQKNNEIFAELLKEPPAKKQELFRNGCYIIYLLTELGKHVITKEEAADIKEFLRPMGTVEDRKNEDQAQSSHNRSKEMEQTKNKYLWICMDNGKPYLYCQDKMIASLPAPKGLQQFPDLVSAAQDPYTGFLGIDTQGRLVNGSAFPIADIKRKAVKAVLNSMYYAVLLEDGSIVHNIRWETGIPERAVNIDLTGERLRCAELI